MSLELKLYPDKHLRKKSKDVKLPLELQEVKDTLPAMIEICAAFRGLGLAANQVGINKRYFIMIPDADNGRVCVNPKILKHGREEESLKEGCLSMPGLWGKKKRYRVIDVEYIDPSGNVVQETFKGKSAQIFQHEMDHLSGAVCIDEKFLKLYLKEMKRLAKKKIQEKEGI